MANKRLSSILNRAKDPNYIKKAVPLPEGLKMRDNTRLADIVEYKHSDIVIHEKGLMNKKHVDEFIANIRSAAENGNVLTWCCLDPLAMHGIMIRDHFFVKPNPDATREEIEEAKTIIKYRREIMYKRLREGHGIPFYHIYHGEIICTNIYTLPKDATKELNYLLSCK